MKMLLYSFLAVFLTAQLQVVHSAHLVECNYNATLPYCSCPIGETECLFELVLEHTPTMASFRLGPEGAMIGSPTLYVLDNTTGYRPALPGLDTPCLFPGITPINDEDFTSRGCSRPITLDGADDGDDTIITINGFSPGPTLIVDYNAIVFARVKNRLNNNGEQTSIHWHGMYQRETPWMDGVGGITQRSIGDGNDFDYIFKATPFGTHWYHSHVGEQRVNGMFAALIVRSPFPINSSELVPEENGNAIIIDKPEVNTVLMDDRNQQPPLDALRLFRGLFNPSASGILQTGLGVTPIERALTSDGTALSPIPFISGLINGRGRVQNTPTPLSVFSIAGGTYTMFRVIGAQEGTPYDFSIDGHTLRVIASDGKDVAFKNDIIDVDFVSVNPGERYDVLVNAAAVPGNYWMRAESQQVNVPDGMEFSARAILSYEGAESLDWRNGYINVPEMPRSEMCTEENPCSNLNCPSEVVPNRICISLLELVPRRPTSELPEFPPTCSDCMYFLNFAAANETGDFTFAVNETANQLPPKPYQTYCGQYDLDNSPESDVNTCEKNCPASDHPNPEEGCRCVNVLPMASEAIFMEDSEADNLESIVMVFSSIQRTGRGHPIHMHGHAFHVVYIGYGTYTDDGVLDEETTDLECDNDEMICINPRWANGGPPPAVLERIVDGRVTPEAIQKDTIIVPAGGYVVVAINADNPGYWFLHCHIEGHTLDGMTVMLQEYPASQHRAPPPGINNDNFIWSIEEFREFQAAGDTCEDALRSGGDGDDDEITVSRVGFGFTLLILILLAIACAVLIVVVIILCIKAKGVQNSGKFK